MCRATLLNVNEPEVRGVALALQTVLDDLGKGLGPLLVSLMVSAWGSWVPHLTADPSIGPWLRARGCFSADCAW